MGIGALPVDRPGSEFRQHEGCAKCKERVGTLLRRIYRGCERDHRFGWQTGLDAYAGTSIHSTLRRVAHLLETHRGFGLDEFVRSTVLSGCDYYVPDPGFIVEFDESQHFTIPRSLTLSAYAELDHLGFSAERWMKLCEHHAARDKDPPFRDEQRAWYDTLRDLIPIIRGKEPTVSGLEGEPLGESH